MAEEHKTESDMPVAGHNPTLAEDGSNLETPSVEEGERASKRIKMDHSTSEPASNGAQADQHVPGEGLHDAPPTLDNAKSEQPRDDRDARRGMAPVKKEYV